MSKPEDAAQEAVDAIFEDLRDRRLLKWLFSAHPTLIGHLEGDELRSLDDDVQKEIAFAWREIIARAIMAAKAEEREACAALAEQTAGRWVSGDAITVSGKAYQGGCRLVAAAIRKRGDSPNA